VTTSAVDALRDALDPEAADRVLPGEARFCCSLPWSNIVLAPPEITTAPATVPGATRLLAALGYDAAVGATVDGQPQAHVAGPRPRVPRRDRAPAAPAGRQRRVAGVPRLAGPGREPAQRGGDPRPGRTDRGRGGPAGGRRPTPPAARLTPASADPRRQPRDHRS